MHWVNLLGKHTTMIWVITFNTLVNNVFTFYLSVMHTRLRPVCMYFEISKCIVCVLYVLIVKKY